MSMTRLAKNAANASDTMGTDTGRTSFKAVVHKLPAPLRVEVAEAESTTERQRAALDVVPEEPREITERFDSAKKNAKIHT